MKYFFYILTFSLFALLHVKTLGYTDDTAQQIATANQSEALTVGPSNDTYEGAGDFSPMQFFAVLFLLGIALLMVGVGIGLLVLGLLIFFGLVSFGVLSTSLVVGINSRSIKSGFKTLVMLSSTIGGLLLGSVGFWFQNRVQHWWTSEFALISGAICGLFVGLLFGLLTVYVFRRLTNYFKRKLDLWT